MKPLVSVVIPMFNAAGTIGRALESLQAQTLAQWHAIVVDDGSTDGSGAIARGMAQEDSRITLVHQPNAGPGAARNRALAMADGWMIHFLDADDWLHPGALRALADRASEGGAAFGKSELVGPDGGSLGRTSQLPGARVGLDDLLDDNPVQTSVAMIRRDVLGDARFNEHARHALDYDLWLRLGLRGVAFHAVPEVVASYRLRPASQSRSYAEQLRAIDGFLAEAYAQARERGVRAGGRAIDASEERRTRAMAALAMRRATSVAVSGFGTDGIDAIEQAMALASPYIEGRRLDAETAGRAGYEAALHATCSLPDVLSAAAGRWMSGLDAWWRACIARGWAGEGLIPAARAEFAAQMVDQERVARTLVEHAARMGKTVTIVGLGNNGRVLARRAIERGLRVLGRDDQVGAGSPLVPQGVIVEPMDAPLARDGAVALTPLYDEAIVPRMHALGAGTRLVRWSQTRAAMASETLQALEGLWPAQPARLVA